MNRTNVFTRITILLIGSLIVAGCGDGTSPTPTTAPQAQSTETKETLEPAATDTAEPAPTETVAETPPRATATSAADETADPMPTDAPTDTPAGPPQLALQLVADGFTAPTSFDTANDGSGRFFVADQVGFIWVVTPDGGRQAEPFLDLRDRLVDIRGGYDERGLLSLAFHPNYAENGRFYVYYSAPPRSGIPGGWNHTSHLSEFRVSPDDANRADAGSERIVLQIDQPQANHNGGQIVFGSDGYLYVALGDGGAANDQGTGHSLIGNGQDTSNLLGSILRIDVDGGDPYAIPPDNPFAGSDAGADEIYAYGLRNPYRFSFDAGGNNALYAGDVGQNLYEEVDIVESGGNYGWNVKEGTHCFNPDSPDTPPESCADTGPNGAPLIPPIIEYGRSEGISVIGGYVYRGSAMRGLTGRYIFTDWSANGRLFIATPADEGLWSYETVEPAIEQPFSYALAFGQDTNNELYLLTTESQGPSGESGRLFRIVPAN